MAATTDKDMDLQLHRNHRQRLKNRYLREGLSGFEKHNILELMLFYAIPQKDTNEMAHRLLNRFGTIAGVFDAPMEELVKVRGIGTHTATLIKLIPDLWREYEEDRANSARMKLDSTVAAASYLAPYYTGLSTEIVVLVALDASGGILGAEIVGEGTPSNAPIDVRRICEWAIQIQAAGVILSHNHLGSGNCRPSAPDADATRRVGLMLKGIGVRLLDHIIICAGEYFSMADNPAFAPLLEGIQQRELAVQKRLVIGTLPKKLVKGSE